MFRWHHDQSSSSVHAGRWWPNRQKQMRYSLTEREPVDPRRLAPRPVNLRCQPARRRLGKSRPLPGSPRGRSTRRKRAIYPVGDRTGGRDLRPRGDVFRTFHHEWRVHQEQGLLWHGCARALRATRIGAGQVKDAEQARQVLPIEVPVDAAPQRIRFFGQLDGATAHRRVEFAGHGQYRIAQSFELQSPPIRSPVQRVVGVDIHAFLAGRTGLPIRARQNDRAMQLFE